MRKKRPLIYKDPQRWYKLDAIIKKMTEVVKMTGRNHGVAVKPGYQRKGIAKVMTTRALKLLQGLEDTPPIYRHTQTWSHMAIRLYQKLGFDISDKNLDGRPI